MGEYTQLQVEVEDEEKQKVSLARRSNAVYELFLLNFPYIVTRNFDERVHSPALDT